MATVPNMVAIDGKIVRLPVRKIQGGILSRSYSVHTHIAAHGIRSQYFAVRYAREWNIFHINFGSPIKTFATEEAAAMWLLAKAAFDNNSQEK